MGRPLVPIRLLLVLAALLLASWTSGSAMLLPSTGGVSAGVDNVPGGAVAATAGVTVVAAGDIASCAYERDSATGDLVMERPNATVLTLGDNVYAEGSDKGYADCYAPSWGRFLDRTRPSIGNHDERGDGGAAYYRYFGARAGPAGQGWYSFDLGEWHVIALNSNCESGGCEPGSAQYDWLVADLAASPARCTLAYWHHSRFSSGPHGDQAFMQPIWEALQADGADVVLGAHDHLYERFAPQSPTGMSDPRGIVQFTAGTGGGSPYELREREPNSEALSLGTYGILQLTLSADAYTWSYVTTDGTVPDSGTGTCH